MILQGKKRLSAGLRQGAFKPGLEYFVVPESKEVLQVNEDTSNGPINQTEGLPTGHAWANLNINTVMCYNLADNVRIRSPLQYQV